MKNKKQAIILSVVASIALLVLIVGATYAYFQASGGTGTSANLRVTTYTTDVFNFEVGSDISIYADATSFASGKGNASGNTFAKAILTANNKTNTATEHYYLYLNISNNTFLYTQNESTPELLLTITDASGNAVTDITSLAYKTVTDGKGTSISGYDITNKSGLITLFNNKEITASPTKTDEWNITVTLVNYDKDQSKNAGKNFSAKLMIQKEKIPTVLSDVCTSGNNLATCITTLLNKSEPSIVNIYHHTSSLANGAGDNSYRYAGGDGHPGYYSCKYNGNDVTNGKDEINKSLKGDCSKIYKATIYGENNEIIYIDKSLEQYLEGSIAIKWDSTESKCVTTDNVNVTDYYGNDVTDETKCTGTAYHNTMIDEYEIGIEEVGAGEETLVTPAVIGVNNFVCLGSDVARCPDANLFRIIGVFGDKTKVIRAKSVGDKQWHSSKVNTWSSSSLNAYLNGEYLTSLGTLADKIATTTWKVGGGSWSNIATSVPKTAYQYEVGSSASSTTVNKKIGLMYVSDYYYSASPSAWTLVGFNSSDETKDYCAAKTTNWLYSVSYEWTISRISDFPGYAFIVGSAGRVVRGSVTNNFVARPSFNLESSVKYVSGSGSMSDPIRIG